MESNWQGDAFICCVGCLSLIPGFTRRLTGRVAFFPPRPATYYIGDSSQSPLVLRSTPFDTEGVLEPLPELGPLGINVEAVRMNTRRGSRIYGFHYRRLDSTKTLLFSHGNSADLGICFGQCLELCMELHIDVLVYDYSGYGQSSGTPSELDLYADIDAAYEYLTLEVGAAPESIVLYGQSLGSVPAIDLASRLAVGGLVLHSALASGLRCIHEGLEATPWFDIFKNVEKIMDVNCKVFIIHGMEDVEVPVQHGEALYEACPEEFASDPWWVPEAGHHDIETGWRAAYYRHLLGFLAALSAPPRARTSSSGESSPLLKLLRPPARSDE